MKTQILRALVLNGVFLFSACSPPAESEREEAPTGPQPEATSLLGEPLYPPTFEEERRLELEANLAQARADYEADPSSVDAIIWLGRRTAYLGRYKDAIEIYSEGLAQHPEEPRLHRHRGHRYISIRQFDRAVSDLQRAAQLTRGQADEIEPDGIPNARNQPTSTLQSNIWYHLGLALYLKGDFPNALEAYQRCNDVSESDDMKIATAHWRYMTSRRAGRQDEANEILEPIQQGMDVIENQSYYDLLLMYKGLKESGEIFDPAADSLASATVGYGVGNWHFYNGRTDEAEAIFRKIVAGDQWAAFGYIAAEAELARR